MDNKFESVNILGVKVDKITLVQATDLAEGWLKGKNGKHYIVTPNPEFIMAAQKDSEFKDILNNADLAIPDGSRLGWASRVISEEDIFKKILLFPLFLFPIKQLIRFDTVAGVDLMEALCKKASDYGFTTGFLGGKNGVAKKTAECLRKRYHKLKIKYAEDGPGVDKNGDQISTPKSNKYQKLKVDILFVGFGAVKQEKWIVKNLDKLPAEVAMGVGGAFDYLSGNVRRAPGWVRVLGLEWLFRLILQPWRIKRQLQLFNFVFLLLEKNEE